MKKLIKILLMVVVASTMLVLAACRATEPEPIAPEPPVPTPTPIVETPGPGQEPAEPEEPEAVGISYPLEGNVTLTYWMPLVQGGFTNNGETPFAQEWQRQTGVNLEFIHPPGASRIEAFNLMIASGDFPDIIQRDNEMQTIIMYQNRVIRNIAPYIETFAPDFHAFLQDNPGIRREVTTDDGKILEFGMVTPATHQTNGIMLRGDWLEELGIDMPETIDDWDEVFAGFKSMDVPMPWTSAGVNTLVNSFVSGFGIGQGFYHIDGVLHYSFVEQGYLELLTTLNRWFEAGYIDPNFTTNDGATRDGNILNDLSAVTFGPTGGQMGTYLLVRRDRDPDDGFTMAGARFPSPVRGEAPRFGNHANFAVNAARTAVISTTVSDFEVAMKFLNYGYTEEGIVLFNFGTEGVSFEWVDGEPRYTDIILNNPEGLTIQLAQHAHVRSGAGGGPFIQEPTFLQTFVFPQQFAAIANYSIGFEYFLSHMMPPVTLTEDERDAIVIIEADIERIRQENMVRMIMGTTPLTDFDEMVETMWQVGLQRVIDVRQAALTRFFNR